ncbi:cytochrome P450 [Aspergillus ambiguus]|uniref:cytochrome P450 n=1 Tax=Aspergillus ambiguus TaxID=176160 RepID=UPI003CCD39D9
MRSKQDHQQRRRIWHPGFTESAVRGYESRIRPYRQQLMGRITSASEEGKPLDISKVFQWYGYDVISDLALGESYGGLQKGVSVPIAQSFVKANMSMRKMYPTWFYRLIRTSSIGSREWKEYGDRIWKDLTKRMKTEPEVPDIFAYFLAPLKGQPPTPEDIPRLLGDAILLIGAGGDTTGMTLAVIIYELARRPEEIQKLRDELAGCPREPGGEYAHESVASLRHLNGVINEAQRMHSGIPVQMPRKTPPDGLNIDGVYVPGDMNILSPHREIGRSEAAFVRAQEFIPERWYLNPELIKDKSAHAPFSIGPYGCIGKPLALMNLRTTIAQLVMTYDIALAPGDDGLSLERNMDEHFSIYVHELHVVFRTREL